MDVLDGVREDSLQRPDGRTVAWAEWGRPDGTPLLRVPGTPGSRLAVRADRTPWEDRGLRVLITERPGFGASTRLPGRGFVEHADDLVAILDALSIERAHVIGGSGATPHIMALCERHPGRVASATVVGGIAPLDDDELEMMIPLNRDVFRDARAGDVDRVRERLTLNREEMLRDPIAGIRAVMATAPDADRAIIGDPLWQEAHVVNAREALRAGVDGWVDEIMATSGSWDEVHPERVDTSITWWHSDADRNCPLSGARRLLGRLQNARLHVWTAAGHLEAYRREPEILDELLGRD